MKTTLPPEKLTELHCQGMQEALANRFIDPDAVAKLKTLHRTRGEDWFASVLLRPLTRRSPADPLLPFLTNGEMETLLLADAAEWKQREPSL